MTKTLYLKNTKRYIFVTENPDGTFTLTDATGKPIRNAGRLISNCGGIEKILARCQDYDKSPEELCAELNARLAEARRKTAMAAREHEHTHSEEAVKAFRELTEKYDVIPATTENISIVAKYLNTMNWGVWELPKMSIGYNARQYDCNGASVVTITLDEPVEVETKFKTPAPRGHLKDYKTLR